MKYPLNDLTVFHKEILDPKHSHSVFAEMQGNPSQEEEITRTGTTHHTNMVIANNSVLLQQLQYHVITDNTIFNPA